MLARPSASAAAPPAAVVVGGGTMGAGVATAFLSAGWRVSVVEADDSVRDSLPLRIAALLAGEPAPQLRRLTVHAELAELVWDGVRIVSENVFEALAVKREVFADLAVLAPAGVPLTSNSSTIAASAIAAGTGREHAIMNVHFLMPAHQVPLVEVVAMPGLDPRIVDTAWQTMLDIGKKPVRLSRELPGFLVNRIQAALMREALALVDAGVASAQDVDAAVRYGFGFRYAACGPLLQKEHSGWDISCKVYEAVFPTLANDAAPPAVLRRMVASGRLGMKTGHGFARWSPAAAQVERVRFNNAMVGARQVVLGEPCDQEPDWEG